MANVQSLLNKLEPPTYTDIDDNGQEVTYTGQLVSFRDGEAWLAKYDTPDLTSDQLHNEAMPAMVRLCKMDERVIHLLTRHPDGVVWAVCIDFLAALKGMHLKKS